MTALLIVLAVLLVLFLLLMLSVSVTVEYRDEINVRASILGIPLWRHPKKKKKIKLSDYTPEKLAARERREKRRLARKKKRLEKKAAKNKKRGTAPSAQAPQKKRGLVDNIGLVRDVVSVLLGKSAKHARLHASRILVTVATDDAAKTAILFGAVNQAVASLIELLDQAGKWRRLRSSEISVKADFAAEKSTVDISLTLSFRVWQLLSILFHSALRYVKSRGKTTKSQKS